MCDEVKRSEVKVRAEAQDAGAGLQLRDFWQSETAHGLMWLNCFLCGLPWTAKPSFLSFSSRCPPHTRSQTAYSAYSAQLLSGGLFKPPVNVRPCATGEFYLQPKVF